MRAALLLLVLLAGCGGAIAKDTQIATANAVDTLTDADSMKRWNVLATSAAGAARDKLLDDDTTKRVQALVQSLGVTLRQELVTTRNDVLDEQLATEVASLREQLLGDTARKLVRQMIDEALGDTTLGEVDVVRERLIGAAFRKDLDDALTAEIPKVGQLVTVSIAPVQAQAAADATKIEHYAEGFGGVVVVLGIVLAIALRANRQHRQRIEALEKRLGHLEVP